MNINKIYTILFFLPFLSPLTVYSSYYSQYKNQQINIIIEEQPPYTVLHLDEVEYGDLPYISSNKISFNSLKVTNNSNDPFFIKFSSDEILQEKDVNKIRKYLTTSNDILRLCSLIACVLPAKVSTLYLLIEYYNIGTLLDKGYVPGQNNQLIAYDKSGAITDDVAIWELNPYFMSFLSASSFLAIAYFIRSFHKNRCLPCISSLKNSLLEDKEYIRPGKTVCKLLILPKPLPSSKRIHIKYDYENGIKRITINLI